MDFIKWLRLKRAAHQLIVEKEQYIINIAFNAGFESHEAFSRAFKKTCGINPSQYRCVMNCDFWDRPPYCLPKRRKIEM